MLKMGKYDYFTTPGWREINLDVFGSVTYFIMYDWDNYRLDNMNFEAFGFLPGGKPMASHTYDFGYSRVLYIRQQREWFVETEQHIRSFINTIIPDEQLDEYEMNHLRSEYLVESDGYHHYYHFFILPDEDGVPIQLINHACTTPEGVTIWEARYSYPTALEDLPDPVWGGLTPQIGYNYFCNSVRYHVENVRI